MVNGGDLMEMSSKEPRNSKGWLKATKRLKTLISRDLKIESLPSYQTIKLFFNPL